MTWPDSRWRLPPETGCVQAPFYRQAGTEQVIVAPPGRREQGGGGKPGKLAKKKADREATQAWKSDDETREKLISSILSGVNRAFPFAKTDDEK